MIRALITHLGRFTAGPAGTTARRLLHPRRLRATADEPMRSCDRSQAPSRTAVITWEEAEQLLANALLAGLIEQRDYQDSLALLAQADDSRRPLQVPRL